MLAATLPFGFPELLLILVIMVLIFGASKLPALGKGLGEGIRNFRSGLKSDDGQKEKLEDGGEPAGKGS